MLRVGAALALVPCLVGAFSGLTLLPRAQRLYPVRAGSQPARLRTGPRLRTGTQALRAEENQSEGGAAPKKKESKLKVFRMLDEAAEMLAEAVAMKPAGPRAESAVEAAAAEAAAVVSVRQEGQDAWQVMSHDAAAECCAPGSEETAEELAKTSAEAGMSRLDLLLQERGTDPDSSSKSESELEVLAKAGEAARTALAEATAEGIPLSAFQAFEPEVKAKLAEFDTNGNGILDPSEIVSAFKVLMSVSSQASNPSSPPGLSQVDRKTAEEAARAAVIASLADPVLSEGTTYIAAKEEDEDLADGTLELGTAEVNNSALVEAEEAARAAVAASLSEGLPLRDGATYTAKRDEDVWPGDDAADAQDSGVSAAEAAARDPALVKAEEAARAAVMAALAETV